MASSITEEIQESGTLMDYSRSLNPSQPGLVKQAWRSARRTLIGVFYSNNRNDSDRTLEFMRRNPDAAPWFVQSVMLFSSLGSLVVCIACGLFLANYWDRCGTCDRPVRLWLLVQSSLQLLLIPSRLALLFGVCATSANGGNLEECISSFTASPAWRLSKSVSLALYGWFVLGVVWWLHSDTCPECPGIRILTGAVLAFSAARAVVAVAVLRAVFPPLPADEDDAAEAAPKVRGAMLDEIKALPLVRFGSNSKSCIGEQVSCAICLTDFVLGEQIRRLPCKHAFHRCCIDNWLPRNERCPLCMQPINEQQ